MIKMGTSRSAAGGRVPGRGAAGLCATLCATLLVFSCGSTDVVAKYAAASFKALAANTRVQAAWSAEEGAWRLLSPAGDEVLIAADFSRNASSGGMADMGKPDVEFSFDAAPFLAAGLDPAKLPMAEGIAYELEEGRLMLHFELGSEAFAAGAAKSLEATFAEILRTQRKRIGYHEKLDHYGMALGNGNMLEWAKDPAKNDKDLVWVLNPEPFAAAGLNPAALAGWTFAKVEMRDDAGKTVFVDKLLKPFDLD